MHVPQNTFESNWSGLGNRNTNLRVKKKLAKEIVVVADDEDEERGGESQFTNVSLTTTFSLDSARPNVAA